MLYYLDLATLIQSLAAAKHLHHALADWSLKSAGPRSVIHSTNFGRSRMLAVRRESAASGLRQAPNAFPQQAEELSLSDGKSSRDPCFVLPKADWGYYSRQAGKWLSELLWVKPLPRPKWLSQSTLT